MKKYISEREGQLDFFEKYNINFENNLNEEILKDCTDGIYHGCILEFKLNINDLNKTLLQAIKYLSRERIKGHNVPAIIFLVDLNKNIVYEFKSKDYFAEIHQLYIGGASKANDGFEAKTPSFKFFLDKPEDQSKFIQHLQKTDFLKIDIDENCIVGWAERYYRENPTATKDDFLKDGGELRKPNKFKDFINPYTGESNEKFKYIMDKLNDKLKKKKLGAFYTPIPYCEKAAELVREAIKRVPEGNDYIIIDRCAGTGNLESVLTDEELSHCVLSTYEYYEWLVLRERLEDKVRMILPVDKEHITFENGLIKENDAMSKEFVENEYIKKFLDNEKCTIIMLENPPYSDETSSKGKSEKVGITDSFVLSSMKSDKKQYGVFTNELANRFIWSGFKYYLGDNDFFVIFSPIKYWKAYSFINKDFINGYIFNRGYFGDASKGHLSCMLFNGTEKVIGRLKDINVYDIKENEISFINKLDIKRCKNLISKLYDFTKDITDEPGLFSNKDGSELNKKVKTIGNPVYNDNIIGHLVAKSFMNDYNNLQLNRTMVYDNHGFYIRKNNYLKKLPLWCTKLEYAMNSDWWSDIFYATSDGGTSFEKDQTFLKSCLIYTALCQFNKCLSFKGSDGRDYYNEICFDSLSTHKSQALQDLSTFKLNAKDRSLIKLYDKIMKKASQTKNYNKDYSYGLYQIIQELNTSTKDEKGKTIYDYPDLNGDINSLKVKLKDYYKEFIEPKCFKYELLK